MSALFDFLPLIAFFVAFKLKDIYFATGTIIVLSIAQVAWSWARTRKLATLPLVTAAMALTLGGLTLVLHDERYIKWKVTVVYWIFAALFAGSNWYGAKPLWQRVLDEQFEAPRAVWVRLTLGSALFFALLGAVNLWVISHYDTATWVNFKVWGVLVALFAFTLVQVAYLSKHGRLRDGA